MSEALYLEDWILANILSTLLLTLQIQFPYFVSEREHE
jgi:hypothetical protein